MNSIKHRLLCGASLLAAASILPFAAHAQEDGMETVVVTGVRDSLRDSLIAKRNAETITENISTKDIGQLPDVTIAEELNRLPGLNTILDRGNASQAAVRGLGPRLVLGLVNGREVASSEPDQNVRWEIYPSEVVGGVSVHKSQTANLIPGGIAATIDIKTLAPLDYEGPSLSLRVGPTYNEEGDTLPHYDPWGLRGSASYITHIDDTLAVSLAVSFQRQKNGYNSFQGWGYNIAGDTWDTSNAGDVNGDMAFDSTPWGAQTEIKGLQQDRIAYAGAIDWRPHSNLRIKFDMLYSAYHIHEDQQQAWYGGNTWGGWTTLWDGAQNIACSSSSAGWGSDPSHNYYNCGESNQNIVIKNGVVVAADMEGSWSQVQNTIALYKEKHTLMVTGFNAEYTAGKWSMKLDLSHSQAVRDNSWRSIYTDVYVEDMYWDTRAGQAPSVTWGGSVDPADITAQTSHGWNPGQSSGPEYTRDHLSAVQFDARYENGGAFLTSLDMGLRVSDRAKRHMNHEYYLCPGDGAMLASSCATDYTLPSDKLETFTVHGFTVPDMIYGDFEELIEYIYPNGIGLPDGAELTAEHWRVRTNAYEAYLKANFYFDLGHVPVTGSLGGRVVTTHVGSWGYETSDGGATYNPIAVNKSYTDFLPSLNLNFNLTDEQIVRFGAAMAMSRPPLDELRTGFSLTSTSTTHTGSGGNPTLNPYRATQIDLGYEWYFHDESLFAVALYYKHLNSFIGYSTTNQTINGTVYEMSSPVNGKGGDLVGTEITFQTRLYFVPVKFFQDFGIYANYAYVNSGVKEFSPSWNPLEATGLAKHTSEIDLWYSAHGVEARLAYKIHSPLTIIAGWNSQKLTRVQWERYLDASVSYQVNKNINIRFQARNLTDAVSRSYYDNNPQELARYDVFGRSFLLDISFHN